MDNQTIVVDEESFLLDVDWTRRFWPRATSHAGSAPGEWDLTIRGSEDEFGEIHKALFNAGYHVDETGQIEVYTRQKENAVETMIDVWELKCDALDADLVFDNYDELLGCLDAEIELALDGETLQFAILREQMTQDEYDNLEEVEP